ncbi:glycosyltransferase [Aquirufa aurantiipilula]
MNEVKILFIVENTISHLEPNLAFAKKMQEFNSDFKIYFCLDQCFKEKVEGYGFVFFEAKSISPFLRVKNIGINYLQKLFFQLNSNLYELRKQELAGYLKNFTPSYVFLDAFCFSDFLILEDLKISSPACKVFLVQSSFNTYKSRFNFPISSRIIPSTKFKHILWIKNELEWILYFLSRKLKRIKEFIIFLGFDDYSLLKRKICEINKQYNSTIRLNVKKSYFLSFCDLKEIYLVPKSLEFMSHEVNNGIYTGLLMSKTSSEILPNIDFVSTDYKAKILISISSIHNVYSEEYYLNIYKVLIYLTNLISDCLFVIIIPEKFQQPFMLKLCNKNVLIYDYISQQYSLFKFDLLLSHGGTNSILESIIEECPLLIVLFNKDLDQNGNAARIKFHGCGDFVDFRVPLRGWVEKINFILANLDFYRSNIKSIKKRVLLENFNLENEIFS